MVLSAINGVGLSLVIPNAQSITADYYDELDRGKAFGALYMTSALGGAIGSLYATNQGELSQHSMCSLLHQVSQNHSRHEARHPCREACHPCREAWLKGGFG